MSWLDTTIIAIVIALGLVIMYKALKEPLDLLFGLIGKGIRALTGKISGMNESREESSIGYS